MTQQDTLQLLEEKQKTHGDAYNVTNSLLRYLSIEYGPNILRAGIAWIMILNKLARLLFNPDDLDTWHDIEGWACLGRREVSADES